MSEKGSNKEKVLLTWIAVFILKKRLGALYCFANFICALTEERR